MYVCLKQFDSTANVLFVGLTKGLLVYTSIIGVSLLLFWTYQVSVLSVYNITSNEDIRHRWNGHGRNRTSMKTYRKQTRCCTRLAYTMYGDIEKVNGPSKLLQYAKMVETW